MKNTKNLYKVGKIMLVILLALILFAPCAIVNAGERGVLLEFGKVQDRILGEGIHFIIPIVNTVQKLSVRVQKQQIAAEASSKDLQDVFTDVALNWHIIPEDVSTIFQQIGDKDAIVDRIINPAVKEVLKAVVAKYTAEEIITKREEVKFAIDNSLTARLANYYMAVDDISLVDVHFSPRFNEAVEAKQIAEQEVKRAEFIALKASKEAEAKINLAKGEAEAGNLLRTSLTPEILQKQALEKWNGNLPLFVGNDNLNFLDFQKIAIPK